MRFILVIFGGLSLILFQNCGQDVRFSKEDAAILSSAGGPEVVICDPLIDASQCGNTSEGLKGNLYYLTDEFMSSLSYDGSKIFLQTFLDYGVRPNVQVLFKNIDVSPRSWESGFFNSNGQALVNNNGQKLNEWFSVRLGGKISLPAGAYEFAMMSDDGMSVKIGGQDILVDDGIHSPRMKCSSQQVSFAAGEMKSIQVNYFQGPRTQIAMQLFVRPSSMAGQSCSGSSWNIVPSSAFSN